MSIPVLSACSLFRVSRRLHIGDALDMQAIVSLAVMLFEVPADLLEDLLTCWASPTSAPS